MNFTGSLVALVTPFRDGSIDEEKLTELVEWHATAGTDGIVAVGTTGESPTLSHDEHVRVVEICVKASDGRLPIIAGTGSNATNEAVALSQRAADVGADALLLVNPYYNKPSQEGIYQHYKAIAEVVDLPQIVYNIPGRTAGKVSVDTMARLAELPNIVGVKDAVGDLAETAELIDRVGPDFIVLSGDDALTLPLMALGGHGVISVLANLMPKTTSDLTAAMATGDLAAAKRLHYQTRDLVAALFVETNPVPVKTALNLMGKIGGDLRLPLVPLSRMSHERLSIAMKKKGLL